MSIKEGKVEQKMYFYRKSVLQGTTVNSLAFSVKILYVTAHKVHCLHLL
jgi:hypothetical protein